MENKPNSSFLERPKTRLAWWVLGLGLGAFFILPVAGLLTSVLRRVFDPASYNPNRSILAQSGFGSAVLSLLFSVSALVAGISALRKGERSWVVWVSLAVALLAGGFWIFMIAGEILFPH